MSTSTVRAGCQGNKNILPKVGHERLDSHRDVRRRPDDRPGLERDVTSSGSSVTARNVSDNGSLGAGAATDFRFIGSWNGTNTAPGVTCSAT